MLTSSLITLIQKKAPEWSTENVRELLNEIQNIMLEDSPLEFTQVKDTSTGKDPKLTAVSGTYEYEISTANGFPENATWIESIYVSDPDDPTEGIRYVPATPSSYAKVIFDDNPSGDYYVRYYKGAAQITSVSVQLTIPRQYHLDIVHDAVIGMIEKIDSGASQTWERFIQVHLPRFKWIMNKKGPWMPNPDYNRGF